jgi:hypothetical protein
MAAPSLGQAIGLNVQRKDIFAPAAKQLGTNLAEYYGEKEKKKKEREDQYSKVFDEAIQARKTSMHIREQEEYNKAIDEFKKELDDKFNSGADNRSYAETAFKFFEKQSAIKKRSDMLIKDEEGSFKNPSIVNSRIAQKIYRTNQQLTADDLTEAAAMGIDINPETGEIMSRRIQYTSIPETIKNIKFDKAEADAAVAFMTEEQKKIASMSPADQAVYKGRKIPGFTQKVAEITRPSKVLYEMKVDNFLNSDRGYTESALQEIEQSLPKGQSLASVISKRQEELKTANNGVEPTLDLVKKSLAKDHFMNMYENWARENAVSDELQRAPVGGGGSGKPATPVNPAIASSEYVFTPQGYAKATEFGDQYGYTPEQIISIYTGENTYGISESNRKKLVDQIDKTGAIQNAPAISFAPGGSEVVGIEGRNYNPTKMWYSDRDKSFYLIVSKQVSADQTTENISQETIKLSRKGMKDLQAAGAKSKSVLEQLGAWDQLAPQNGWPTIDQYIGGGASGSSSRPSGGAAKPSGKGMTYDELKKKGLNEKDYKLVKNLWYKK